MLAVALAGAGLTSYIAGLKNRDRVLWFFAGLVLWIVALPAVMLLKPAEPLDPDAAYYVP